MATYRAAIVGTGNSVGNHLGAVQEVGNRIELVAAVDLDEARVKDVCEKSRIPHWYTRVSDMLEIEQPDLVCIVTPPATHKALVVECLDSGAWVFCEKPLCVSLAEFDEISQVEARTGRYVSTVFQWRFGSAGKHLKKLIEMNTLGRPLVGICNTLWYRTQDYYNVSWRGHWATEVGGPTATLGIHLMDLFLWLMEGWEEVWAKAATLKRAIEVEDISMAMVRFGNGAFGTITNSALSPRQESYMRLDFQRATAEVTTLYRYSNEHWRFSLPPGVEDPAVLAHWQSLTEDSVGSHGAQLREILDSMERGERPLVSGDEARRILEFIASLYKSSAAGRPVRCGDLTPVDPFYHSMGGAV